MARKHAIHTLTEDAARDETAALISSDKVEGTSVYDGNGNPLGSIHSVMIRKVEGEVAYAVLTFGGLLGIGADYYPLPWSQLRYDVEQDGYVVAVTAEQLEGAPRYGSRSREDWDENWANRVDDHYGLPRGTSTLI